MDIIRPICPPTSKGHRFILAITHYFLKWVVVIRLKEEKAAGYLKITKDKATNTGLIRMRGSHFNLNADFKANTRVVFQLRCRLYQVGDVKIEFNTKLDSRVDHQNANLSSFMF